jgi:transposase
MTTSKTNKNNHESKLSLHAGIDVGSEELVLVIRKNNKPFDPQKFTNTPADRARLVKKLAKLPGIIVCLEATGIYHFDWARPLLNVISSIMP